jgi:hypothetical protein
MTFLLKKQQQSISENAEPGSASRLCSAFISVCCQLYCICSFFVTFFSATIDGRNLIFGHKLHIQVGTPYRGKRFWTHQIPTSCLSILLIFIHIYFNIHLYMHIFLCNYWWQESDIWSQASYRYAILWEAFLDPSDSYFLFADLQIPPSVSTIILSGRTQSFVGLHS